MKTIFKWLKETFSDTWLVRMIDRLIFSLDNDKRGFSGKKLTALALTYCIVQLHEYYASYAFLHKDFSILPLVLGADFGFLTLLFGLNEYSKKRLEPEAKPTEQTTENPA